MGWTVCNATEEHEKISETALWDGGVTFHNLSLIVGGVCALLACIVSIILIMAHAMHYSKAIEQRHIIRILWMVPIYSIVAWLSILFYNDSVYFEVMGDCYEAFAIASFFSLLCSYIAPDLHSQKDYFRGIQPKPWLWPLSWFQKWTCCGANRGAWRNPRSGLTWFNVIWAGVFQYCLMRVLMTIVAVSTQATGRYCEESLSPAFAYIWVLVIESVSVSIAMYCLIQFYIQIKDDIKEHNPFLKILSIKLVIFLSFWQSEMISLLMSSGAVKASSKINSIDLKYSLPELLINIEMFIFAILHLWAFPKKPYVIASQGAEVTDFYGAGKESYGGGKWGFGALGDAMNPLDLIKAIGRSARWLVVGRKNRTLDPSYHASPGSNGSNGSNDIGLQPPQSGVVPQGTAYQGAAAMAGGRTGRYPGSPPDEEGAVLLAHAQANPEVGPHGTSPYASDAEEYLAGQSGSRFYGHDSSPSPYFPPEIPDTVYHGNAYDPHPEVSNPYATMPNPYPVDGPLREQIPMPIPDPYRPPPPYPESHHAP
ncbi:hypothetical protein N7466_009588 [Penicillium verhagenii]|uniref:uncharacterized protein n=1 Tax=Penicillium verhagenii TaxID=1562060 RepID=UPI0025457266|nr:uncharacterized protein N7466_009588 [Penicillium verhagenii]KAJ5921262.1 hypothetical protein N7466_009588 [Penicillium verhagenii]